MELITTINTSLLFVNRTLLISNPIITLENNMIRRFIYYIIVQLACYGMVLAAGNGSNASADSLFIKAAPDTTAVREWQQNYSFAITVTDNKGRPRRVGVIVDDPLIDTILTLNTDSDGKATYQASVPFGTPDGTYQITFQAKKNLFESSNKLSRFVLVEHDYAKLNIEITPEAIFILGYGDKVNYLFAVSDEYGNLIDSAGVFINSKLLKYPVKLHSDSIGAGETTIIIPEGTSEGEYQLRFFAEKFGYSASDTIFRLIRVRHSPNSVISNNTTSKARLFPNPAGDYVNIILTEGVNSIDNIRIYDYSGEVRHFGITAEYIRDNTLRVYFPNLDAGCYFIALAGQNRGYIFPLIVK